MIRTRRIILSLVIMFGSGFFFHVQAATPTVETSCSAYMKTNMNVDEWEALQACEERFNSMVAIKKPQQLFKKALQDNKLSSGIKGAFYTIEWCSPRYRELGWSSACKRGYFQVDDKTIKVLWNGQNFSFDQDSSLYQTFKQAQTQMRVDISAVQKNPSNLSLQSIFKDVLGVEIDGEGAFRIFIYTIDYADNVGKYELYYKVDRTAPSVVWQGASENSDYIYYTGAVSGLSSAVGARNDSFKLSATSILRDGGNPTIPRPRIDLGNTRPTFYYSRDLQSLNVALAANDTWNNLTWLWSGTYPLGGRQVGQMIAGISKTIDLYSAYPTGQVVRGESQSFAAGNPTASNIVWHGRTEDFKDNPHSQPSTAVYRLRVYDTTLGKSGTKGNYMEYPLYVVLDTTPPNGGSATGIVFFSGTTSVCDQLLSNSECHYSKFFTADDQRNLTLRVSDIDGGKKQVPYNFYNAGLLSQGNIMHRIEQSGNQNALDSYPISVRNDYITETPIIHDFSNVQGDVSLAGGYRYYKGSFISTFPSGTQSSGVICDRVANCTIIGDFSYRVMAGKVNSNISTLSITGTTNQVVANGRDAYILRYALRDSYNNPIIPVDSQEGNESASGLIRDVITGFNLRSALEADMRSGFLTSHGNRDVIDFRDIETDNLTPISNTIITNSDGNASYLTHESPINTSRNGEYGYRVASSVPTYDGYPWLSPDQTLSLLGSGFVIKSLTNLDAYGANAALYDSGSYAWTGLISDPSGPSVFGFSGFTENPANKYNISSEQIAAYGKIQSYNGPLSGLEGKRLAFAFASPVATFWKNLDGLIDGTFKDYSYVTVLADPNFNTNFRGYARYEKYPACEIASSATVCTDAHLGNNPLIVRYQFRDQSVQSATGVIGYAIQGAGKNDFFPSVQFTQANSLFTSPISIQRGQTYDAGLAFFSLPGKVYDTARLRVGIVSGLSYVTDSGLAVHLPGPSRNIFAPNGDLIPNNAGSYNYFHNTYSIGREAEATRFDSKVSDIGIIGYTNTYNAITSDTDADKGMTFLNATISASLKNAFRKNAAEASRGIPDNKWCRGVSVGNPFHLDLQNTDTLPCIITSNGEKTVYIDGDVDISCDSAGDKTCDMYGKKLNVFVKNGATYINSNISTLSSGGNNDGKIFIGAFVDDSNNTIITDTSNMSVEKGWIGVDTTVTNIDAFIFTEGPLITTKQSSRTTAILSDSDLKNQLYVYGGLFAQNTVGGSRKAPAKCPFTVDAANCSQEVAQIFDLTFLRRYHLVNKMQVTGNSSDSGSLISYDNGLRAGGGTEKCSGSYSGTLRCIKNDIYQGIPVIFEKNELWIREPSLFMKN